MPAKKTVATPSSAYQRMSSFWKMVEALLGGTPAMRSAGQVYLPMHDAESKDAYRKRLDKTVLFNQFNKTLTSLSSKPFSQPVKLGDSMPEELKTIADDVDQCGSDITRFSRQVFKDGLAKGFTHILVDFPEVNPEEVKTLADEKKMNLRPYFVHISAESLIAAYSTIEGGKEKINHARIMEQEVKRDGFEEIVINRVRVYEPGLWQIWEQVNSKGEWKLVRQGTTKLNFVPIVTFYTQREGFLYSKPPLMDLAYKNIEHWQSSSDQRNVLTVSRFPILAASGVKDNSEIKLGPRILLASDDPDSEFYYLEHEGNAIKSGKEDLDDLKDEMAALGIELLVRKGGSPTATEKSINTAQSHSELQAMAVSYADCLKQAFWMASKWMGVEVKDEDIEISVHTDFGISEGDVSGLEILAKARSSREISREAYITELKRRGILRPEYDAEEDAQKLEDEPPPLAAMMLPGRGQTPGAPGSPNRPPKQPSGPPAPPKPPPGTPVG